MVFETSRIGAGDLDVSFNSKQPQSEIDGSHAAADLLRNIPLGQASVVLVYGFKYLIFQDWIFHMESRLFFVLCFLFYYQTIFSGVKRFFAAPWNAPITGEQ